MAIFQSCTSDKNNSQALPINGGVYNNPEYLTNESSFVGSKACQSCHEKEFHDWKGSDHERAMMVAGDSSVLGDFDDVTFKSQAVTSKFFKQDGKFYVNTAGPDGNYRDFEITYTFGIRPLQQYIVEFPKGKYQCLRTAWDTEKNKWFDLYPNMKIVHEEWLYWTNGGLRWNIMCADCHSTLVKKNYVEDSDAYHTTYALINVSCEACHGPGKKHIEFVSSKAYKYTEDSLLPDHTLFMKSSITPHKLVDKCARCHSLRTQFTKLYDYTGDYMDHYSPDLLRDGVYFADGQIQGEDYVYGSFIQSKMYKNNVTCSNCHNVHSLELKFKGNTLCLQCHEAKKYDTTSHHFHTINTDGAQCINCHMPGRFYMVNDYRRDHSFRIPRPDLSVKYGTPNACNNCHKDKSDQWSADAVDKWYGTKRPKHFSEILAFGRTREEEAIPPLIALAKDQEQPAIARSTAIWYLSQTVDQQALMAIEGLLIDKEPLVRYTSARLLDNLPPSEKVSELSPLLNDSVRTVRIAAAKSLIGVPSNLMHENTREYFAKARDEFITGMHVRADFPGGQMELAQYYEKLGQIDMAEKAYKKAIEKDNYYNPARINLASLYYNQKRFPEAQALFEKVIEQEPDYGQAYYSLGLLLAEQNKMEDAAKYLKQAVAKIDYNDRVAYNYGLVLQNLGKNQEAEKAFKKGLQINPNSVANLYALGYLKFQQKNFKEAEQFIQKLIAIDPNNAQYQQMLSAIRMNQKTQNP